MTVATHSCPAQRRLPSSFCTPTGATYLACPRPPTPRSRPNTARTGMQSDHTHANGDHDRRATRHTDRRRLVFIGRRFPTQTPTRASVWRGVTGAARVGEAEARSAALLERASPLPPPMIRRSRSLCLRRCESPLPLPPPSPPPHVQSHSPPPL